MYIQLLAYNTLILFKCKSVYLKWKERNIFPFCTVFPSPHLELTHVLFVLGYIPQIMTYNIHFTNAGRFGQFLKIAVLIG